MKKIFFSFSIVLLMAVLVTSCKKVVTALFPGMDVKVPDVVLSVPAIIIAPPNELSLGTYSANFNLDSIIRANTSGVFNANDIASVKVKSITISVQNSDNLNNLSNFDYARLTLSSNTNTTEAAIATINFPDAAASTITVNTDNSPDIRNYLSGNQLNYNVYGKMRRPTTKPLSFIVSVTLRID